MDDMDVVRRRTEWSDRFFNYVPAEQAAGAGKAVAVELRELAGMFLEANPKCPYSPGWLVEDFLKRL